MTMFFSRTPCPRAGSLSKPKRSPNLVSFLPLLVLLMMTSTVMAGIACQKDNQCRRDVCIFNSCSSKGTTGGVCQINSHCFKAPTEVCITNVCSAKSNTGENCDETLDCASASDECKSGKCTRTRCNLNNDCPSPEVCITNVCSAKSNTGGDCDETLDCASASDECKSGKCTFNPFLLEWEGNKAITVPRFLSAGVAVGEDLFVFGGYDASGSLTKSVEKYSPLTNSWEEKSPVSVAVYDLTAVSIGQLIFFIGGYTGTSPRRTIFSYNTVTDQWDEAWPQLPRGITNAAAAAVGNTIYLFGGDNGSSSYYNTIFSIDTSSKLNQWVESSTAFLDAPTIALSAVTVGTDIYLIGGQTTIENSNKVYKYNTQQPATSPVDIGKNMLLSRFFFLSFYDSASKRLYAVGGDTPSSPQNSVEYLDLSDSGAIWKSANAPNYVSILSKAGGVIGSKLYFTANVNSKAALQVLDFSNPQNVKWSPFPNSPVPSATIAHLTGPSEITLVDSSAKTVAFYDITSNSWSAGTVSQQLPASRSSASSAAPNGVIHVMGGQQGTSVQTSVYYFDRSNGWITAANFLPAARTRACAAASDTQIFFYGGSATSSGNPVNSLFVSNLDANGHSTTWSTIDNALSSTQPTAVLNCAAVVVNGKLLIFGGGRSSTGNSPTGKIQSFDISSGTWDSPHSSSITPRSFPSVVLLKDFVFIIGGTSNGQSTGALVKVEAFDTKAPFSSTSAVTVIDDMLTPRYNFGSVTDGSSIFSIGGPTVGSSSAFPSLEKLH